MAVGLKRQLGVISAISYVTGGTIGAGIFIAPSTVLAGSGSSVGLSLCIWALCGFVSYLGAFSYAELGTRIKTSGGSYTYVRQAFGDLAGFCVLWTQLFVVRPLAAVLGSMATAEYLMRPFFMDCPDMVPSIARTLLGSVILGLFVACNCYSVRVSASFQTLSTVTKVGALVVIIVTGIVHLAQGHVSHFEDPFVIGDLDPGKMAMAFYGGFYAFVGWDHINNAVEEVENPRRTMPIAILGGLAIPTVTYLLANVAYHAVLTNEQILSGVAVAVVFGEQTLGWFKWVLFPCIAISAAGIANVIIFTSSRLNFVGGRDGVFPKFLGTVNTKRNTPMPTVLLLFVFGLVIMCLGDIKTIIGTYSFYRTLPEAVAIAGIWRIRKRLPSSDALTVPLILPLVFVLAFTALSLTAIIYQPQKFLVPLIIVLLGIPAYIVCSSNWWTHGIGVSFNNFMTKICQRLLLCDFSRKSS